MKPVPRHGRIRSRRSPWLRSLDAPGRAARPRAAPPGAKGHDEDLVILDDVGVAPFACRVTQLAPRSFPLRRHSHPWPRCTAATAKAISAGSAASITPSAWRPPAGCRMWSCLQTATSSTITSCGRRRWPLPQRRADSRLPHVPRRSSRRAAAAIWHSARSRRRLMNLLDHNQRAGVSPPLRQRHLRHRSVRDGRAVLVAAAAPDPPERAPRPAHAVGQHPAGPRRSPRRRRLAGGRLRPARERQHEQPATHAALHGYRDLSGADCRKQRPSTAGQRAGRH